MSLFAFYMSPEFGVMDAPFALAGALKRRGHRVQHFVPQPFARHVTEQGFEPVVYELPLGLTFPDPPFPFSPEWIRGVRLMAKSDKGLAEQLRAWLQRDRPDAVLIDPMRSRQASVVLEEKIPTAIISPALMGPASSRYPPIFDGEIPEEPPSLKARARNLSRWALANPMMWERRITERIFSRVSENGFQRLRRLGQRVHFGDTTYWLDLPTLVTAPRALDYDELANRPERLYLGSCVYDRNEGDFDWSWYDPSKPLAYCALGSVIADQNFPHTQRFFDAILEAFQGFDGWQLLLGASKWVDELSKRNLPKSIKLTSWAPQLQALSRAQVFITHAGMSSLRQALHYGVPMVLFPFWGDHFGHSARVVHRKVGVRSAIETISAKEIRERVTHVTTDPEIQAAVKRFKDSLQPRRELEEGADFVERLARAQ